MTKYFVSKYFAPKYSIKARQRNKIVSVGFLMLGLFSSAVAADPKTIEPLSGQALYSDVKTYANFGEHRTGGAADVATSQWVLDELQASGIKTSLQPFALTQFFNVQSELIVDGVNVEAFPHWLPKATEETGIVAPLAYIEKSDLSGFIAYVTPKQTGLWHRADISRYAEIAASKGALALIVAVPHPSGEIYVRNAAKPWLQKTLPIPTVVVAKGSHAVIDKAKRHSETVSLKLLGKLDKKAQANNVIGKINRGNRWIVISTPTSGWFQAAGERGGGVALFLGLARWLSSEDAKHFNHSILFIANSGHELNYMGAHHSMTLAQDAKDVDRWLHLGASIGARSWQETEQGLQPLAKAHQYNVLFAHPQLLQQAKNAFSGVPDLTVESTDNLPSANGELVGFINDGYQAMGMVGNHRFFHTPRDIADVTSAELLAPYGEAVKQLILSIESAVD